MSCNRRDALVTHWSVLPEPMVPPSEANPNHKGRSSFKTSIRVNCIRISTKMHQKIVFVTYSCQETLASPGKLAWFMALPPDAKPDHRIKSTFKTSIRMAATKILNNNVPLLVLLSFNALGSAARFTRVHGNTTRSQSRPFNET